MSVGFSLQPAQVTVEAGGTATATLTVRNTSSIVERYTFLVLGPAAGWADVDPPAISLLPGAERTVTLRFHPPRQPSSKATTLPFAVQVIPTEHADDTAVEEGDVTVGPFFDMQASLRPKTSRGATVGHHILRLTNGGNTDIDATISASDPDELLRFRVRPEQVHVRPGTTVQAAVTVKPRRTTLTGQVESRPFQVLVHPTGGLPSVVDGGFMQRPMAPRWLPKAALAVAVVAAATAVYAGKRARVTNVAQVGATTTVAPPPTTTATTVTATTAATAGTATTQPPPTTSPPTTNLATSVEPNLDPQALACYSYDPISLATSSPVPSGTTSTTGAPSYLVSSNNPQVQLKFADPTSAATAKVILSQYTQLCYIGKGASLSLEATTLEPYKAGGPVVPPGTVQKCDSYDKTSLVAQPAGSGHPAPWIADLSTQPPSPIQSFATETDAKTGLALAKNHAQRCWVGGGTTWTSLDDPTGNSILEYWR